MNNELIKRIDYCLKYDELPTVARQTFQLCLAALSQPVASSQDESTLAFFCKYDFDNVAKIDDGRAAVFLSRDQWGEIRRAAIGKPVAASQPTELEMHRADYNSIKAAGFDSPGELLAAYNTLTKSVPQDVEEFISAKEWNQATGRDGKLYTDGWNDCRNAMITASKEKNNE